MSSSTPRNAVKRNVLVSWGAHVFAMAIGFFLVPYIKRVLGEGYGSWIFINSIASYAGLLYFGFGETISRYVSQFHSAGDFRKVNQVVSLVLAVYLVMGLIALTIAGSLCLAAQYFTNSNGEPLWQPDELFEIRVVILILGLNVAIGLSGSVFGGVLLGLRRFDLERGISITSDLIRLILVWVFLQREWGLVIIAGIYTVICLVENISYVVLAYRLYPQLEVRFSLVNREIFRECSHFSTWAFVNTLAGQVIYATDTIVIGMILGKSAIVPYYLALRLAQIIKQPIDKISQISMPTAGGLQGAGDRLKLHRFLLKACGISLLLTAGMWIGAYYFGDDVLDVWVDTRESHTILLVLVAGLVVAMPLGVLRAGLFGTGHVAIPACIYMVEAICNLTASILLCYQWGILGVAIGTLLPVVVIELALLLPYALRTLEISLGRLVSQAILPQIPALLALWAYCLVVSHFWDTYPHDSNGNMWNWLILGTISAGGGAVLGTGWWLTGQFQQMRTTRLEAART